jgi:glycosyltransferase involved in cell wall biosynthesis
MGIEGSRESGDEAADWQAVFRRAAPPHGTGLAMQGLTHPHDRASERPMPHLAPSPVRPAGLRPTLLVFSHLRFGFVYQRPQHLMSRLAAHWDVLFVEEPVADAEAPRLEAHSPCPGVTVLLPRLPLPAAGFHDEHLAALSTLLADELARRAVRHPVVWLYTPMALPLALTVEPSCLVYDCMDELSAFQDAPRQLQQRERALLERADVVFTGGPSLFEARSGRHPNLHCVPSSVDAAHFAPSSLQPDSEEARRAEALQGRLARPRLGFFGVIDERLDRVLVTQLADRHPEWQLVMVGPVVKIDPATLPQRPNLHWLGMQPYAQLPYLLAGWDLCLLPFARNEATRFISPTKTLEYMAGEKPVVSTAIPDVASLYGHAVEVADGEDDFIAACEKVLHESRAARCQRLVEMLTTVSCHSWDRSAATMHALVLEARERRAARPAPAPAEAAPRTAVAAAGEARLA